VIELNNTQSGRSYQDVLRWRIYGGREEFSLVTQNVPLLYSSFPPAPGSEPHREKERER